ncbi:MAG: hypothetical protein ABF271_05805 [Abyssibacter sp.]|uniref:hypothetical protein n=1 Tax=Abyssibacter sp. TaxID=2320200 RepID=UPI00321B3FC0
MTRDIDAWLDGLAGRRPADDPLDQALARVLQQSEQPSIDAVGHQRLLKRLEREGLLGAPAGTRRPAARTPGLAVAASLVIGVSLGWWLWPHQPQPLQDRSADVAGADSPAESAELAAAPASHPPPAQAPVAEPSAAPGKPGETRALAAQAQAQADAVQATRAAPDAHPPHAAARQAPPQAKQSLFAAAHPRLRLPAAAGVDLDTALQQLMHQPGLTVQRFDGAPEARLVVRWTNAASRQQMIQQLPATLDWPALPDQGVIELLGPLREQAP